MPYVSVNLAQTLNDEQKTDLARALSQAVTVFPGKPRPEVTMVDIEDGKMMFFGDTPLEHAAYVEIGVHGHYAYEAKDAYTAQVTKVLEDKLAIPSNAVYLTVSEYDIWGVRGKQMTGKKE